MKDQRLITQLNNLLLETSGRVSIYRRIVFYSKKNQFRSFFRHCLNNRLRYIDDIKTGIYKAGGRVKNQRNLQTMVSILWTDIKATISNDPELTMLEDINQQDKDLLTLYSEILKMETLPALLRNKLQEHYMDIESDLAETENMNWVYAG